MSLSITLMNALSGLQTNQSALQVTSNNISNVNTPGYSRKIHEQSSRLLGGVGAGVQTQAVLRKVDEFLRRDVIAETTDLGYAETRNRFFERMQDLFGSVGSNNALGNSITHLASALEDVATTPEVAAHRFTAVTQATVATQHFQSLANQIQLLRTQADAEIDAAVNSINTELASISEINAKISENILKGLPFGDLQDQRDRAITTIADYMKVQEFTNSSGETTLMSKEGRLLVSSGSAGTLDYTLSPTMTAAQSYPAVVSGISINGIGDITTQLGEGRLAALIEMRDTTLPAMTVQLDTLAAAMRDQINQAHNRGANTPFGNGQAVGDAAAMYGSRVITTPTDPLTLDTPVVLQLLDAAGNAVTTPLTIAAGATTPAAIVTAINAYLNTGPDYGEAVLVSDRLEIKLETPYRLAILDSGTTANSGDAQITFDADGDTALETYFGFSNFFGLNDMIETPQLAGGNLAMANQGTELGISSNIQVRASLVSDPDTISRGKLRGTSPNFTLGSGDNEIAQQLADVFGTNFSFAAIANGPPSTSTTLGGYAGTILSFNAAGATVARDAYDFQNFFYQDLINKQAADAGVNLDEELSNMVIYQNAYNAAARMVQAADELFDTLVNLV